MSKNHVELTAEIVAAYLGNPSITYKSTNIPELIKNIDKALVDLY